MSAVIIKLAKLCREEDAFFEITGGYYSSTFKVVISDANMNISVAVEKTIAAAINAAIKKWKAGDFNGSPENLPLNRLTP